MKTPENGPATGCDASHGDDETCHFRLLTALVGVWAAGYFILPLWLTPRDPASRLPALIAAVGALVVAALVCRFLLKIQPSAALTTVKDPDIGADKTPLVFLAAIAALWLGLQFWAMHGRPLDMGWGDEEFHAGVPAALVDLVAWRGDSDYLPAVRLAVWVLLIGIVVLCSVLRRRGRSLTLPDNPLQLCAVILVAAVVYALAWSRIFSGLGEANIALFRYPPLDPALRFLSLLLFGISETAVRLPGLALSLLAAWYLYRLGGLISGSPSMGVAAACLLLFHPGFFHWTHQVYLVSGQAAIFCAMIFYLVRHLKFGHLYDAAIAFILAGTAVLYERSALPALGILWLGLGVYRLSSRHTWPLPFSAYLRLSAVAVITMLPWLVITHIVGVRPLILSPANWLQPDLVWAYPLRAAVDGTWPVAVLAAVGVGFALWRRQVAGVMWAAWGVLLWVVYTSDVPEWIPTSRFLIPLAGGMAFLAAFALLELTRHSRQRGLLAPAAGILAAWQLVVYLFFPPPDVVFWREVNIPVKAGAAVLADRYAEQPPVRLLDMTFCSTLPFYLSRERLRLPTVQVSWYSGFDRETFDDQSLLALAQARHCDLVVYSLPACREPYPGTAHAETVLRRVGEGESSLFEVIFRAEEPRGAYYITKPRETR